MQYPTTKQVKTADQVTLARWYRFLPSPGTNYINNDRELFDSKLQEESRIMDLIIEKLDRLGGITPAISKLIGW